MSTAAAARSYAPRRARPQDADRHVGARIRERRITLGLTQHQLAELIGVTYQQAYKYEKGTNRIAAGRLLALARALQVDVGYFFTGIGDGSEPKAHPQQRLLLELVRHFANLPSRRHQEALCQMARALAGAAPADGHEPDASPPPAAAA